MFSLRAFGCLDVIQINMSHNQMDTGLELMRLLIFLPAILIPACASSSPAFLMMYSAYKLNN